MAQGLGHQVHAVIDEPAEGAGVDRRLRVRGWVLDAAGPLDRVLLIPDGMPPVPATLGLARPDVAEAHPSIRHAEASGFACDLEFRAAADGPILIELLARTREGTWSRAASVTVRLEAGAAGDGGRRPRAAFTVVQNEPVMLPLWLDYYGRHFDAADLYVLDHGSTDGSTVEAAHRCHVVPIRHETSFDHRWLRQTVERFQAFLLSSYDTVLFAEADEFIVADPRRYAGLGDYMSRLETPAARCVGFNVVHQPDEPPLRFGEPILAQRRYWHASLLYAKRLISQTPLSWSEGFHREFSAPDDPPDPALTLVHLHRVDYGWCLERHRATAARNWSADDIRRSDGWQNRIHEPADFESWFRSHDLESPRELIPEHIRGAL